MFGFSISQKLLVRRVSAFYCKFINDEATIILIKTKKIRKGVDWCTKKCSIKLATFLLLHSLNPANGYTITWMLHQAPFHTFKSSPLTEEKNWPINIVHVSNLSDDNFLPLIISTYIVYSLLYLSQMIRTPA